jgi:putative transposase
VSEKGCIIDELNVQPDYLHFVVSIPPKVSVSSFMGKLRG